MIAIEIKKLWRYFLVVFLIIFLFINWGRISWIFNSQIVSGLISDIFQRETKEQILIEPKEEIDLEDLEKENNIESKEINLDYSKKENSLEIPKIGVVAPLIVDKNLDDYGVYKAMDRGVVCYPGSVLPNEVGQTIVLGHSAPSRWPKVKYYHIFDRLNELVEGDEIHLYFEHKKYRYIITQKLFLESGEEIPQSDLTNNKNMLYLISCWPPGTTKKRIAVGAELKTK